MNDIATYSPFRDGPNPLSSYAQTYIEGACETTCARWRHKPDADVPGLGRCSFCLGVVGPVLKNVGCKVSTDSPAFPDRADRDEFPCWRDSIGRGDRETDEVAV